MVFELTGVISPSASTTAMTKLWSHGLDKKQIESCFQTGWGNEAPRVGHRNMLASSSLFPFIFKIVKTISI